MTPSSKYPGGDGINSGKFAEITFKDYIGIQDGNGNMVPFYTHLVNAITQNYTAPEFLNDLFGGIEITTTTNYTYRGQLDPKIWDASFETSKQLTNLVYPTEFTATIALQDKWVETGYKFSSLTRRTTNEWATFLEEQERGMVTNKKFYDINKTLAAIVDTCLATGNFKIIEGLTTDDDEDAGTEQQKAFRYLRNAIVAWSKRWTTQYKGIPSNYQILFAPYALQAALDAAGQTSITATAEQWAAYERGMLLKWMGFNIREFEWLENAYFARQEITDPATDQRVLLNTTSEEFKFYNVSAVLFTPNTVIRKAREPIFLGVEVAPNGFPPAYLFGGNNTNDLARVWKFTLDAFVEPFKEAQNMVVFNKAPTEQEILDARKRLVAKYPTLYLNINKDNGYQVGDSEGTKTKAIIAQWLLAARRYKYNTQEGKESIPQDSNLYLFKENWVNFNGITPQTAKAKAKSKE